MKRYEDGTPVLSGIDLTLRAGEFCVLLGPSGCGKSTLLRSLVGLCPPSAGTVKVDGIALSRRRMKLIRRRIGMIHQAFGLVDRLSALQNVMAGAAAGAGPLTVLLRRYPLAVRERAMTLLGQVGIDPETAMRAVRTLSGGQRQRVGIARALIARPALVLADEPVASLDPSTAHDVLALLRDLARDGEVGVLCSLHHVGLARDFADRIVALSGGEIVFDGPPDTLPEARLSEIYAGAGVAG